MNESIRFELTTCDPTDFMARHAVTEVFLSYGQACKAYLKALHNQRVGNLRKVVYHYPSGEQISNELLAVL